MELTPGQVVDRYRVEALLASGGMAKVYRVRHTTLDTLHALKVLLLPAQHLMERLIQEGKAQARLKHPNIVAVTDVVEVQGAPGLVMEIIEGPSLHELLRAQRLTIPQADVLGRNIVRAVAHAHDHGMIHRDLKPANVMLAIEDGELIPKITDFGLAKLLEVESGTDKTASGLAMGTPCYMAPEQYRDAKNVDARADIFSLGAILYELVVGARAFPGEEMIEVYQKIAMATYDDPAERVDDLPERMAIAIRGALLADPAARWRDCDALLEAWCGETMSLPRRGGRRSSATWGTGVITRAAEIASGSGSGTPAAFLSAGNETSPEANEETRMPPPTLDPGSDIGSSETLYDSLQPSASQPSEAPQRPPAPPTFQPEPDARDLPPPLTPLPAEPSRIGPMALVMVFVFGLSVPLALAIGLWMGGVFGEPGERIEPPDPTPAEASEPEPAPTPEPAPEPEPVEEPASVEAPAPAPTPAPARPAPAPAPAAPTGTVRLEGDGTLRLRDADGSVHTPGAVPAGRYTLLVTFDGKAERDKGTAVVKAGATVFVRCDGTFNRCKVQ